jgi:hypothetical protein
MTWFQAKGALIEVTLQGPEIAILSRLASLLGGAGVERDDPARVRLLPKVYAADDAASREYDRLVGKEHVEVRSADRETFNSGLVAASAGPMTLTANEAAAWARVMGEARIVLAARKGIFEEGMPTEPVGDPEVAFIVFLGAMLEELVEQMLIVMEGAS